MATEPQAPSSTAPTWSDSPIDNELPTYRAISTWAVASLILGVISIATFASLSFLVASVGAILCGTVALRTIRRYPDLLTGAGLANFGIAIGLITGLAAPTIFTVQHTILGREAKAYTDQLASTMQEQGLADAFWLAQYPGSRAGTTPQRLLAEVDVEPSQQTMPPNEQFVSFKSISRRLEQPDQHIHVDGIESRGYTGTTPFAYVRLMLDGPETTDYPPVQYALLRVEGADLDGKRQWYVKEVVFPYEAGSQSNVVESAHGHDH